MAKCEDEDVVTRFVPMRAAKVVVDENREFAGLAIAFNRLSLDLGGFKERIAPSAVDRTLKMGSNVDALIDHRRETTSIIGSTDSGLLRLKKEDGGLRVRITPPDTSFVRDLVKTVRAGLVKGMSFAFRVVGNGQLWEEDADGQVIRTVTDMEFSEVSIVVNPAYLQTEISARNHKQDQRALDEFREAGWKPSLDLMERIARAGMR